MKTSLNQILTLFLIFLLVSPVVSAEKNTSNIHDKRISLGLTDLEKVEFLEEMRQMLISIQGIMTGLGTKDRALIIKSAKYSGNRMARETPDSVKKKTPALFKKLGGPTHMKFEELAVRAEDDDMDELAELTGELMKNCLACHSTFKVD